MKQLIEEKQIIIKKKENKSKFVATTGIIASLYIALGYIFQPISFLGIQFRIAEVIVGFCILFPYSGLIGNCIGVFVLNLSSPLGPLDLISTIVNVPALYCIILLRHRKYMKYIGGLLYAFIISVYVAWLLNFVLSLNFLIMFIQVFISESILASLGILLFNLIEKKYKFE